MDGSQPSFTEEEAQDLLNFWINGRVPPGTSPEEAAALQEVKEALQARFHATRALRRAENQVRSIVALLPPGASLTEFAEFVSDPASVKGKGKGKFPLTTVGGTLAQEVTETVAHHNEAQWRMQTPSPQQPQLQQQHSTSNKRGTEMQDGNSSHGTEAAAKVAKVGTPTGNGILEKEEKGDKAELPDREV